MIIQGLTKSETDTESRVSAQIIWEESDKPDREIYFSVNKDYSDYLHVSYDPFLIAALVPAMRNGESRITVEGDICPHLLDNLYEATGWLYGWYEYPNSKIVINAGKRNHVKTTKQTKRSAIFLSGGVDSLSCLSHNLDHYPSNNPLRISAGVYIYGFDIGGREDSYDGDKALSALENVENVLSPLCQSVDIDYLLIKTNVRHLDETPGFWGREFCGAAISSCGHAIGEEFSHFYLSSAGRTIEKEKVFSPFGNHPVLDHNYSSERVHIQHYQCRVDSRIERIGIICNNDNILNSLRVCFFPPPEKLNCEHCEKCVRTKLGLYCLGKLQQSKSFKEPLKADQIRNININSDAAYSNYIEIRNHLDLMGSDKAIISEIDLLLRRYKKWKLWKEETDIKGLIKRIDRKILKGTIKRLVSQ